jgi:LysM repeat protein
MLPAMTAANAGAQLVELSPRPAGCPFLIAEAGGWRLDAPSRDHRCGAFSPVAPLAPEKQSRLCLTDSHLTCATYLASVAAREARLGAPPPERATRWGLARTTTVIEDPGGVRSRVTSALLDRRRWPAIPAVLLVTGLFILAISGFRGFLPTTGVAASPSAPPPTVVATASAQPTTPPPTATAPRPTGTPTPTEPPTTPSSEPTQPATTPKPTFRTYTVKPGDTLSAIAAKYHTTVAAIAALNHITDPGRLSVGQVLLIPN